MRVLVSAASKHGSAAEVAEWIARAITAEGHSTDVAAPEKVESLDDYDAVVLGSAVYVGRWMASARDLIENHAGAFKARPVWLFSIGPLGDPPEPATDPADAAPLVDLTGAREHKIFAGRLDAGRLSLAEKAIVALVRAPYGDYRQPQAIGAWGAAIGRELATMSATPRAALAR